MTIDQAAEAKPDTRTCSCHSDDAPVPCPRKFAYASLLARSGLKRGQKRPCAAEHFRETFLRVGLIAPDTEFNRRAAAYAKAAVLYFRNMERSKACGAASDAAVSSLPQPALDAPRALPGVPAALRPPAPSVPHLTR